MHRKKSSNESIAFFYMFLPIHIFFWFQSTEDFVAKWGLSDLKGKAMYSGVFINLQDLIYNLTGKL